MHSLIAAVAPPNTASAIKFAFDCMGVAEEALKRARMTKAQESSAFGALCPSAPLRGKSLDLYAAHAREIIARVGQSKPLEPATDAELLALISDTSLKAPLRSGATAVAEHLFAAVFPEKARKVFPERSKESWTGQVAEEIAAMRRKFSQTRGGDL